MSLQATGSARDESITRSSGRDNKG